MKAGNNVPDPVIHTTVTDNPLLKKSYWQKYIWAAGVIAFITAVALFLSWHKTGEKIVPDDYKFGSKTVITAGVPNSVVFDFNAAASPYDSVIISSHGIRNYKQNFLRTKSNILLFITCLIILWRS